MISLFIALSISDSCHSLTDPLGSFDFNVEPNNEICFNLLSYNLMIFNTISNLSFSFIDNNHTTTNNTISRPVGIVSADSPITLMVSNKQGTSQHFHGTYFTQWNRENTLADNNLFISTSNFSSAFPTTQASLSSQGPPYSLFFVFMGYFGTYINYHMAVSKSNILTIRFCNSTSILYSFEGPNTYNYTFNETAYIDIFRQRSQILTEFESQLTVTTDGNQELKIGGFIHFPQESKFLQDTDIEIIKHEGKSDTLLIVIIVCAAVVLLVILAILIPMRSSSHKEENTSTVDEDLITEDP